MLQALIVAVRSLELPKGLQRARSRSKLPFSYCDHLPEALSHKRIEHEKLGAPHLKTLIFLKPVPSEAERITFQLTLPRIVIPY